MLIHTVGHGSRTLEDLLGLLRGAGVGLLVDVRSLPRSRKFPRFDREALERSLPAAGIAYEWEGAALGGFRKPRKDSPHSALAAPRFRAYADHMGTEGFRRAAEALLGEQRAALMCAERLPWRCHRWLLSDWLAARGARVVHIISPGQVPEHSLSPLCRLEGERLIYDVMPTEGPETGPARGGET